MCKSTALAKFDTREMILLYSILYRLVFSITFMLIRTNILLSGCKSSTRDLFSLFTSVQSGLCLISSRIYTQAYIYNEMVLCKQCAKSSLDKPVVYDSASSQFQQCLFGWFLCQINILHLEISAGGCINQLIFLVEERREKWDTI